MSDNTKKEETIEDAIEQETISERRNIQELIENIEFDQNETKKTELKLTNYSSRIT